MANVIINDTNLTNIANAIREKNGTTNTYLPSEMAAAITSLPTGSGGDILPEEAFMESPYNNDYRFYNENNFWLIENYPDRFIYTLSVGTSMFSFVGVGGTGKVKKLPMKLKFTRGLGSDGFREAFYNFSSLESIDDIEEPAAYRGYFNADGLFTSCYRLRTLPKNMFGSEIYVPQYDNQADDASQTHCEGMRSSMFLRCYSLRELPNLKTMINIAPWNTLYYDLALDCYALNEIVDLPVTTAELNGIDNNNEFSATVGNCHRLKNFTFEVNADGTAKTANWCGQHINLAAYVGWVNDARKLTDWNSGCTGVVTNDANYRTYKDTEDWYTTDVRYSRYNLTSAIATLNSLPDCSAYLASTGYANNTIKFRNTSGKFTDGGQVNDLTEEQIAAAAARGWTVSFTDYNA